MAEYNHAAEMAELKRIELQMQLGFITRRGLILVCGVSPNTVTAWERSGLNLFRNGTNEAWCKRADFEQFVSGMDAQKAKDKSK